MENSMYILECGTVGEAGSGISKGDKVRVELHDENGKTIFVEGIVSEEL